ncbi:XamI restriction endonuclease [Pseudacidovorax intermedius]|uniref:XamI restriction endonuclease n=1 Tax=Pseudacidovorax intermedius TaxID=433924 RepID=A0A370F8D8_9BURK|nr:XamI family restriction endonuclease [Pseudacidovorax intermedius]RDI20715.1 XamI restriction endonuclease [Pseudacidovorax intermedius]
MSALPPRWTTAELAADAEAAAAQFRVERLAVSDSWDVHYKAARRKFEQLFEKLSDLNPGEINEGSLSEAYGLGLGEALRYLAGPPISDDDLRVIADVDSIAPGVLSRDPVALQKVFGVIERVIDPHRFPWMQDGGAPSEQQREAALLASSVLLAAQRIATERRNDGKESQETRVKDYLRSLGFEEVPPGAIKTMMRGPQVKQFCAECMLGERKADVVLRLHDERLMPIECKVSNSATNSIKRLNNDAAVKAVYWIQQFGALQVVPAAVLGGVFKVLSLEQAQARGLSLFWSHDLEKLGAFIESTA